MLPAFVTIPAVGLALAGSLLGVGVAAAHNGANMLHHKPPLVVRHMLEHRMHDLTDEQREALKVAMEKCDYSAWKAVVGDKPITQKINEGNFARFCEATKLLRDHKVKEARAIFKELGIKPPLPFMKHMKHGPKPHGQH
ncbi:MAG: hypothetical protein U0514_02435 [Candidatus Andersenbacteria bacterium]